MENFIVYRITLNINSNFNDYFEYVTTITSILLATVAIWATIYTTRKQNKTAMFEKRLKVFRLINFISDFYFSIRDMNYEINSDDEEWEDLFEFLMYENKMIFSIWVSQRLTYSQTCSNPTCPDLLQRAMKGDRDRELHDIMQSYFFHDLNILQQGEYVFKGELAKTIKETRETYYNLIGNLLMLPNGNGAHSIDFAKKYFNDFKIVEQKWQNPRMRKRLKKDLSII